MSTLENIVHSIDINIFKNVLQYVGNSGEIFVLRAVNCRLRDTLVYDLPILSAPSKIIHSLINENKAFPQLHELNILPSSPVLFASNGKLTTREEKQDHNQITLAASLFPRLETIRSMEHFLASLKIDSSICLKRLELRCGGYLKSLIAPHKELLHLSCELSEKASYSKSMFFVYSCFI